MTSTFQIGKRRVGPNEPTYFIAEVGSNFDRSLDEAYRLVDLAKESGADAIKFQSFLADKIVSEHSFRNLKVGFQSKWKKDVFDVYRAAEFPRDWHEPVARYAASKGIDFFSSPYDLEAVDLLAKLDVPAYKIGSGDVNWLDMVAHVGRQRKPVLIATGAAPLSEVDEAVRTLKAAGCHEICLMQCITNYPSHFENANLRVLETFAKAFPDVLLGYSDHTAGDVVTLGAVTLGARVIEKHFTSSRAREGPDHPHSMEPQEFRTMVERTRALEAALGTSEKVVTPEEKETSIVQRRSLHAGRAIRKGETLGPQDVVALRPSIGIELRMRPGVVGRVARRDIEAGEALTWDLLG